AITSGANPTATAWDGTRFWIAEDKFNTLTNLKPTDSGITGNLEASPSLTTLVPTSLAADAADDLLWIGNADQPGASVKKAQIDGFPLTDLLHTGIPSKTVPSPVQQPSPFAGIAQIAVNPVQHEVYVADGVISGGAVTVWSTSPPGSAALP